MGYDLYVKGAPELAPGTYLGRTEYGMSSAALAMHRLGMAYPSGSPGWPPSPGEAHITWNDDGEMVAVTEVGAAYLTALTEALVHHPGDTPGIPWHKLGSNDGWHVTAAECAHALAAYDQAMATGGEHPVDFHGDLIPFLRLAARHDGFEVR